MDIKSIVVNKDNVMVGINITPSEDEVFRLIYEDVEEAEALDAEFEEVKWDGQKWKGSKRRPEPEDPEPQENPFEALLFRISMLEAELGHPEHAIDLIESGRLNPDKQAELQEAVQKKV